MRFAPLRLFGGPMPKKPTAQDAQLLLQLYHIRQETEMRKARHWWLVDFWPESPGDYLKIEMARKTRESNWLRQVVSYWGMAASFVLHHTLSESVFLEQTFSGEMFVVFAKVRPFLKELRKKTLTPDLMRNIEKVILGSPGGRKRLKEVAKRIARRKLLAQTPAKKTRKT
jgi:hypothetical protein